uniref:Cytoplasmic protein NCK2-like n=1 Tax=Petromyzon marinus TaxID=7757 RepID=A0AAJ7UEU0_PETMA|nr:cytoplasmic protein NCK2-like [Petromyzon marinus]
MAVVVARYDYTAGRPDELSLARGARIAVTDKCSDGWWRGHLPGGATGWFPGNYVAHSASADAADAADDAAAATGTAATGSGGGNVLEVVLAKYPFSASSSEELSFGLGEHLEVLDKPLDDPEWWHCRRADGATGMVPRNYVRGGWDASAGPTRLLSATQSAVPHFHGDPHNGTDAGRTHNHQHHHQQLQQRRQQQQPPPRGAVSRFPGRPWYRASMSRHMAEAALNERGENGDFVVRNSESSPSDLSLSVRAAGRNRHFRVGTAGGVFGVGQRLFGSMDALVEHYGRAAPIFTGGGGERFYLVRPLP